MSKKVYLTDKAPKPIGPYSQAIEAGGFVFFAGQIPIDPTTNEVIKGDVTEEAVQVMKNIEAVLKAASLTFDSVVKSTVYLTSMDHFAAVNEVYGKYFKDKPPARTTIAVAQLPKNVKVEIEILARRT